MTITVDDARKAITSKLTNLPDIIREVGDVYYYKTEEEVIPESMFITNWYDDSLPEGSANTKQRIINCLSGPGSWYNWPEEDEWDDKAGYGYDISTKPSEAYATGNRWVFWATHCESKLMAEVWDDGTKIVKVSIHGQ